MINMDKITLAPEPMVVDAFGNCSRVVVGAVGIRVNIYTDEIIYGRVEYFAPGNVFMVDNSQYKEFGFYPGNIEEIIYGGYKWDLNSDT